MSEEEFVEAIFQRDLKIKKLNEKVKELENKYSDEEIRNTVLKKCNEVIEKDYVSKDKIREKIKELEKEKEENEEYGLDCTLIYEHEIDINAIIKVLQELLK